MCHKSDGIGQDRGWVVGARGQSGRGVVRVCYDMACFTVFLLDCTYRDKRKPTAGAATYR